MESNIDELQRITTEAGADEASQIAPEMSAVPMADQAGLAQEFADILNLLANVSSVGLGVNVAQRFTPTANLEIAKAAIKLCEKYGKDPRALLIGENSVLGAWLGLGLAVGVPGYGVYRDIKANKAKPVEAANDDNQQQSA